MLSPAEVQIVIVFMLPWRRLSLGCGLSMLLEHLDVIGLSVTMSSK